MIVAFKGFVIGTVSSDAKKLPQTGQFSDEKFLVALGLLFIFVGGAVLVMNKRLSQNRK